MWGSWEDGAAISRVDLTLADGKVLHIISRGGPDGSIMTAIDDAPLTAISAEDRFKPLAPGFVFTPFELQTSFIYWTDYVYEGTEKLLGRPAHYFILYPPENTYTQDIAGTRVAVDADFEVLMRAEELDSSGDEIKTFRINSFKEVDNQWIVKEIDLVDDRTRDRTRFRVTEAHVGLTLSKSLFDMEEGNPVSPSYKKVHYNDMEAGNDQ